MLGYFNPNIIDKPKCWVINVIKNVQLKLGKNFK